MSTPDSQVKPAARSFKDTLNLPQTPFPMKANLVQNEPASIKRWGAMNLYQRVRVQSKGAKPFVFHDGPPYANGSIHLGHLMNKCLKDFVVRSQGMAGFDCPYVPGWDCHGLPIEHKVMTELVEKGKYEKLRSLSDDNRRMAVRRECKAYAEKFHKLHTQQFTRLMTLADYEHPYLTMQPEYEAAVLEVLADLLERGLVYRALKPVHWSIANETALAEAELEYQDREDLSVYVDFEARDAAAVYDAFGLPVVSDDDDEAAGDDDSTSPAPSQRKENREDDAAAPAGGERSHAPRPGTRPGQRPCFMIWTTTPWTLPANLAIAVNPKFTYALVWVDGNVTVLAADAVERVTRAAKSEEVVVLATTTGEKLVGLKYAHPFVPAEAAHASAACFTVVAAEYVTLEDGTGLVHTAPGHGVEDYQTGLRAGLPIYCPVKGDGTYDETAPDFLRAAGPDGKLPDVWKANELVATRLRDSGHMFFDHRFTHSYPHDWRSKTPTIFRCTEQWFVSVDGQHKDARAQSHAAPNLREMALTATAEGGSVSFVPEWGRNRMRGMLESRPDWCISRQRAWGLPIPAFFYTDASGKEQTLMTAATVQAVAKVVREKGSDAWFTLGPAELLAGAPSGTLPAGLSVDALRKGGDILDVWFESGSSWNAVMRQRGVANTGPGVPHTDLYLEGSDQHRGWFQLSLLPSLGATGVPPFKTLLTHGFMVDKDGKKLSKSKGDSVEDLFTKFGVDVLRWWVSSLAYENDVKVDEEFFNLAGETYRKVRNTLRFMLSNLYDFTPTRDGAPGHCVRAAEMPPASLDAWVLAEFDRLNTDVQRAYAHYDFRAAHFALYNFCNDTLSATYLAAVKDRLYCDTPDSPRRRRTQTALWDLTDGLCRLLAPILTHTADEAYRALLKVDAADTATCIHTTGFANPTGAQAHPHWPAAHAAAAAAQQAMERAKKDIGVDNPLDMSVALPDPQGKLKALAESFPGGLAACAAELADLLGVSRVSIDTSLSEAAVLDLRTQARCERSWKRDGTVKPRGGDGALLSDRDAAALGLA